jgi:Methane oxygenase PmoA
MLALLLALAAQIAPREVELPSGAETLRHPVVRRDGKTLPAQIVGKKLVFLADAEKAEYTLVDVASAEPDRVLCIDDGKRLTISVGNKRAIQYNYAVVPQPDPVFSRSGYLHPIWTPSGSVVTNDSPRNHLHHHGIWSAWTSSMFEGRKSNFWESKEKQGRVECIKVEESFSGPVFAGFRARHRFINLNGPDGEKVALEEVWGVRVYALDDRFLIDLVSTQSCATDQPLLIKEYRYGGIGFRGSADWEGSAGVEFLTSEGKNRVEGHATRAKWVVASVGFLGHTSNFRDPQPLRIHPSEPFFNWAVPQGGDFSIEPRRPYIARYRFIVSDGRIDKDSMDRAWTDFNTPSTAHITFSK